MKNDEINMTVNVGTKIKELCSEKGITPLELERYLNISNSSILRWEQGTSPTLKQLLKVSEYFNVSIDYLAGKSNKRETLDYWDKQYNSQRIQTEAQLYNTLGKLKTIFAGIELQDLSEHDLQKLKTFVELILDK